LLRTGDRAELEASFLPSALAFVDKIIDLLQLLIEFGLLALLGILLEVFLPAIAHLNTELIRGPAVAKLMNRVRRCHNVQASTSTPYLGVASMVSANLLQASSLSKCHGLMRLRALSPMSIFDKSSSSLSPSSTTDIANDDS